MRVYLASRYSTRRQMRKYAKELRKLGIRVSSTWHEAGVAYTVGIKQASNWQLQAARDYNDLDCADTLVMFVKPISKTGGRHVEFGYAVATGKRILLVGKRVENVFQDGLERVKNWKQAKRYLVAHKSAKKSQ